MRVTDIKLELSKALKMNFQQSCKPYKECKTFSTKKKSVIVGWLHKLKPQKKNLITYTNWRKYDKQFCLLYSRSRKNINYTQQTKQQNKNTREEQKKESMKTLLFMYRKQLLSIPSWSLALHRHYLCNTFLYEIRVR